MKHKMKKCFILLKQNIYNFFTGCWLYDPNFEISGEKWRIHKFDIDQNFPSVPHMDCVTNPRKKMNIYSGEIFVKGSKKSIGKASKKEIKRLWEDYDFRKIVYSERIRYFKQYNVEYKENIPTDYIQEYFNIKSNYVELYIR